MSCAVCASAPGSVVVAVPTDEGLEKQKVCISCASRSGFFCRDHQTQHLIFSDHTSACPICVANEVRRMSGRTNFHNMLMVNLGDEPRAELYGLIPHQPGTPKFEQAFAELVVTTAQRLNIERGHVTLQLLNHDHRFIVPPPLLAFAS
ncbi:MAG: hypothetical protein WC451_03620 [Patescibacteria group bacterium]